MAVVNLGFKFDDLISDNRTTVERVSSIKGWQRSTPYPKLTDEQIGLFLIACRNDREFAKRTIVMYFETKLGAPEIFRDRNVASEDLRRIANVVNVAVMPKRLGGAAVMVASLKDTNYRNFDFRTYVQLYTMTLESLLYGDPPTNVITVMDSKGVTLLHMTKMRLKLVKHFANFNQSGNPPKLGKIYVLNVNYVTYAVVNFIKPFLQLDVLENMEMHKANANLDRFYDCIPRAYLPKELGGELEPIGFYSEENLRRLASLRPYFEALQQQVYET
ncbi:hypothetical protein PPYR_03189 [Photinus pyralis]|uniref:CRAL-TRIO domain-containing protein n=1 Tax=Photinus pyralis TaxID=7054 RepID=A0A5N4A276_PHOPY|nr:uncharacterized protein LOC116161796 [Photinus pyralis]KAB0791389.1 hypothetical protein PPYR_03189 [Photinus pyralis]